MRGAREVLKEYVKDSPVPRAQGRALEPPGREVTLAHRLGGNPTFKPAEGGGREPTGRRRGSGDSPRWHIGTSPCDNVDSEACGGGWGCLLPG